MRVMWRKKDPVRLEKKKTLKEKIQNWINKYYGYLLCIGIIIAFILFVYLFLAFMPGNESGVFFNNRTGWRYNE